MQWDLPKSFNPSQRNYLLDQTIIQKLMKLVVLMKICYIEWPALYVFSMNPSPFTVQGWQGMEEVIFYAKTIATTAFCPYI